MVWLLALPVWVVFWNAFRSDSFGRKISDKYYMVICAVALIFVMGLRSRYTGTMDTDNYINVFEGARKYSSISDYLSKTESLKDFFLFSEIGFSFYTWIAAKIFPEAQMFLVFTAIIVVSATARFILLHSDDPLISWITFICLGSMTFAMNGMRQALAMSICLLSYRYVREKKPIRFLLVVLLAVLFHKSAVIFALVYLMRNMKPNLKSISVLLTGVILFLAFAERLAFLYDDMTGEDYAKGESFESGGLVTILIYLIAIVGILILCKDLKSSKNFLPLSLIIVGFSLYLGRFISTQIYERISYYFAYFLMLIFPIMFRNLEQKTRLLVRIGFVLVCFALFAYRISNGVFVDFQMFWQEN